MNGKDEEHEKY